MIKSIKFKVDRRADYKRSHDRSPDKTFPPIRSRRLVEGANERASSRPRDQKVGPDWF